MSLTPGMTPVKKQLRKFTNLRIHDEQLFTDDDDPVPDFGEKVSRQEKGGGTLSEGHN